MNSHTPAAISRSAFASAVAFSFALLAATQAQAAALQIDDPWQTAADNTGTVDASPITASLVNNRWRGDYSNDTNLYERTGLWGANALPVGTIGDFLSLTFQDNTDDVMTITLNGALTDPIFYFGDLDVVGSSVTVNGPDVDRVYTSNADGEWNGNVLTTLAGAGQERQGAFGAVRFLGSFAAGTEFVFEIDYDFDTFASDNMAVGVGIIPIPAAGWLFASALGLLGASRRLSRRPSPGTP